MHEKEVLIETLRNLLNARMGMIAVNLSVLGVDDAVLKVEAEIAAIEHIEAMDDRVPDQYDNTNF